MFKGTEDTEEDKEELTMDEKSPSVTSLNERTLFRQKSKSGSEKDQENEEKQIEDVRNWGYNCLDLSLLIALFLYHQFKSNHNLSAW